MQKLCISPQWLFLGEGPKQAPEKKFPAEPDMRTLAHVQDLQKRVEELEQENKKLELEAKNAQKELVAAYRQAMDAMRELAFQKGFSPADTDVPAFATNARSTSPANDR